MTSITSGHGTSGRDDQTSRETASNTFFGIAVQTIDAVIHGLDGLVGAMSTA
jgi:hypothetical protein